MSENEPVLPWLVIRQDDNGNRYRVGRYATRLEAERVADRLDESLETPDKATDKAPDKRGRRQLYIVERVRVAP
ncbi:MULTISPECIES: SPOR domain-containing protein [Streptomyces]|uniref:SPOR domain-containing protein n=1 Tax=Streptomyces TaxID=1883 RepID=UPI00163C06BF|nr:MULTISPECIES: SPOR domain-containing protein [Streptomyces]MBC2875190.1 SPOR domain-containing protein [Streptomyces sp. TYQ1024]UBI37020.1 SPOR domain-containing protein [Streptomyces mobaraensis]UKW29613.1 SPOR domain-containing protein [Streptomyces sp. TYQ1024]